MFDAVEWFSNSRHLKEPSRQTRPLEARALLVRNELGVVIPFKPTQSNRNVLRKETDV
jgi:hypothetical protein